MHTHTENMTKNNPTHIRTQTYTYTHTHTHTNLLKYCATVFHLDVDDEIPAEGQKSSPRCAQIDGSKECRVAVRVVGCGELTSANGERFRSAEVDSVDGGHRKVDDAALSADETRSTDRQPGAEVAAVALRTQRQVPFLSAVREVRRHHVRGERRAGGGGRGRKRRRREDEAEGLRVEAVPHLRDAKQTRRHRV